MKDIQKYNLPFVFLLIRNMLHLLIPLLFLNAPAGAFPPSVPDISLETFNKRVLAVNDTLYVVNFWATWCKPCIAELPWFEEAGKTYSSRPVKILLLSLDFLSAREGVEKFVASKGIQSEVALLNAGKPQQWIDLIDPAWSGAIPATVCYRNGKKRHFYEGDFTQQQLNDLIGQLLQKP